MIAPMRPWLTRPVARAPVARPSVVVAEEYSQSSRLREEVEAPFAKVRLFVWPALMAGAAIATYFAGTSLLAEAVGAREPAPDSLVNLGVDLAALLGEVPERRYSVF